MYAVLIAAQAIHCMAWQSFESTCGQLEPHSPASCPGQDKAYRLSDLLHFQHHGLTHTVVPLARPIGPFSVTQVPVNARMQDQWIALQLSLLCLPRLQDMRLALHILGTSDMWLELPRMTALTKLDLAVNLMPARAGEQRQQLDTWAYLHHAMMLCSS